MTHPLHKAIPVPEVTQIKYLETDIILELIF